MSNTKIVFCLITQKTHETMTAKLKGKLQKKWQVKEKREQRDMNVVMLRYFLPSSSVITTTPVAEVMEM